MPDGPEMEPFYRLRHEFEKEFTNVSATISGSTAIEPIVLDIDLKAVETLLEETVNNIESEYRGTAWTGGSVEMGKAARS